jgi:hypothetical protein
VTDFGRPVARDQRGRASQGADGRAAHRVRSGGYEDVTTYIQSGNVVFSHPDRLDVVERNPYPGAEATTLHVLLLADFDALDVGRLAPETLVRSGREIYLHLPDGMGRASR